MTRIVQLQLRLAATAAALEFECMAILNELEYELTPGEQAALVNAVRRAANLTMGLRVMASEEKE